MISLTDSHTHLYSEPLYTHLTALMAEANHREVTRFYLPAIDSSTHARMHEVEAAYPDQCFAMMGIHPCSVGEDWKNELDQAGQFLYSRRYVAVGEIGLDFYWDRTHAQHQLEVFQQQMQWALELNLPVNIHTRDAMQATIDAVKPFAGKGLKGIFHCFGGSYEMARDITEMGFLLGIGGVLTYKNAGLPAALEKIDLSWLVLETDAPYLTPVPHRGKPNLPAYLRLIAEKLALVKQVSLEELSAVTTRNCLQLYRHD